MDKSVTYRDILTRVVRHEGQFQPRLVPVRIDSVCDDETGQYLMVATGWEREKRINCILFHACLHDGKIIIEEDNTEEGLRDSLIQAGIAAQDILSYSTASRQTEAEPIAA